MISQHAALIYTMVMSAAVDRNMEDAEFKEIGRMVRQLPAFATYDQNKIVETAQECAVLMTRRDALDHTLGLIANALNPQLRETAYLLACETIAIDGGFAFEEMRFLQKLRHALRIDRLVAVALERATMARFATA